MFCPLTFILNTVNKNVFSFLFLTDLDAVCNGLYWPLYVQVQKTELEFLLRKIMWINLASDMHVS